MAVARNTFAAFLAFFAAFATARTAPVADAGRAWRGSYTPSLIPLGSVTLETRPQPRSAIGSTRDRALLHRRDELLDAVAHQVKLGLAGVVVGLVHRQLGGRQAENQEAFTGIDVW